MKSMHLPKLNPWSYWVIGLSILILGGAIAGLMVFTQGLHITNLTDLVPWGLWIVIDLSAIALSAGAFTLCAAVYLLGLKQYQPVARTACWIGLLGYTIAVLSLLLDIGRPDRFWHAIAFWNVHSLLWEVTMCVTLYLTVLALEVLPIVADFEWLKSRYPKLSQKMHQIHKIAPVLALFGLGLSMLHQSSLGAALGVIKAKPFWYSPSMSVLFMISAIAGGMSLTVFASMLASRLTPKAQIKDNLMERIAYFIGWVLVVYLYFRIWDTLAIAYNYVPGRTEGLKMLTSGLFSFNFWVGEILLGILIPVILLLNKKFRERPIWRMAALLMVVGGVVAHRYNIILSGQLILFSYLPGALEVAYTQYTPALIEWVAGIGVIAYGLLGFSLGVKYLKVVNHVLVSEEHHELETVLEAT